jgi:hypothetical protein
MGIDLRLLPVDGDFAPNIFYSHQVLSLDRNAILADIQEIAKKHGKPLPSRFTSFIGRQENGEHGYGEEDTDPYGAPLQYVLVKHLKPLAVKVGLVLDDVPIERETSWSRVEGDALKPRQSKRATKVVKVEAEDGYQSQSNRAAFAYICALPDDYKIVLYWH